MSELIGLIATLFVLISFLQKSEINIRKFNIVGASLFVIYGFLISSISVWLLNGILLGVHIKRLKELYNEKK